MFNHGGRLKACHSSRIAQPAGRQSWPVQTQSYQRWRLWSQRWPCTQADRHKCAFGHRLISAPSFLQGSAWQYHRPAELKVGPTTLSFAQSALCTNIPQTEYPKLSRLASILHATQRRPHHLFRLEQSNVVRLPMPT